MTLPSVEQAIPPTDCRSPQTTAVAAVVTPPQPQTLRRSSQDNVELMTQKEVLNFKPAPRLEQIGDKCGQQMEDREHRTG
jgi:hypothetical protein